MRASRENQRAERGRSPVELTEVEWEIMRVVWARQPCAAGTVQEELARTRNRAYSTVKTLMDRMVEKEFLRIEKIRNLQLFTACVSEVEARRGEFRKMLKRAFDGALTPMMQFLIEHEGLSKEDAAKLRELVDRSEGKKSGRSRKRAR